MAATDPKGLPRAGGDRDSPRGSVAGISAALAALTQAALLLPGAAAAADLQSDYLYSDYREADIPGARSASGRDSPRYDIQTHLFRLVQPLDEQVLGLNLSYETLSGASPWYITPDVDGRPVQVMSGASIREQRYVGRATWSLPLADTRTGLSAGYSKEDDYESVNGGVEVELNNADQSLTWTGGAGYSHDVVEPVRGRSSPDVIDRASKNTLTVYGGAALVIDANTVAQASLSFLHNEGYLSDPYKLAWMQDLANTVPDNRPLNRRAWVLSAKLRHHFNGPQAALALDYRYYDDDWDVDAHTLDLSWHQLLPAQWRLSPSLRWYSQSQAFFYAPYYVTARADGLAASDYRLSPFGALALRLDASRSVGDLDFGAGIEQYEAKASYALKSVEVENPGLVEYLIINLRLSYRF